MIIKVLSSFVNMTNCCVCFYSLNEDERESIDAVEQTLGGFLGRLKHENSDESRDLFKFNLEISNFNLRV